MRKTVIVTGVSSGVGAAVAQMFIDRGDRVFGLARRATNQTDLAALGVVLIDTDLSQTNSINKAVSEIKRQTQRIDIVTHVAGVALNGAIEDLDLETAEMQFKVNVFGVAQLTQAILPIMRQQKSGRIVVVTSSSAWFSMPLMGWYSASKRAIEGVLDSLRLEVAAFNIQVSMIEPGGIDTPMTQSEPNFVKVSGQGPYSDLVTKMARLFKKQSKNLDSPDKVAKIVVKAATVKNPRIQYRVGRGIGTLVNAARMLPPRWLDKIKEQILQ